MKLFNLEMNIVICVDILILMLLIFIVKYIYCHKHMNTCISIEFLKSHTLKMYKI